MNAKADPLFKKLAEELSRVIKANKLDRDILSKRLNVHPRHLDYWLSADRILPVHVLPELCRCIEEEVCRLHETDHYHDAYKAMDILEDRAGRHAFSVVPLKGAIPSGALMAIQRLAT